MAADSLTPKRATIRGPTAWRLASTFVRSGLLILEHNATFDERRRCEPSEQLRRHHGQIDECQAIAALFADYAYRAAGRVVTQLAEPCTVSH